MGEAPDPVEVGEACAEIWARRNIRDGKFRCPICGERHDLAEASPTSPGPIALPICPSCAELCSKAQEGDEEAIEKVIELTRKTNGF